MNWTLSSTWKLTIPAELSGQPITVVRMACLNGAGLYGKQRLEMQFLFLLDSV